MEGAAQRLEGILKERAQGLSPEAVKRLTSASQVVFFGSFAAGVESNSSDLDVFCVGESRAHFKTPRIEVLILPEYDLYSDVWLGSELANHIRAYGIPLTGQPEWFDRAQVSPAACERKERRINAYVRSLEFHWSNLTVKARSRYQTKLRREFQRLKLLRSGEPVPATQLLDLEFERSLSSESAHSHADSSVLMMKFLALLGETSDVAPSSH